MLDRELLLALAAMAVEGFYQRHIGAGKFAFLEVLASPSKPADHGAPVAFHCGIVGSDQLRQDHPFQFVLGRDAHQHVNWGGRLLFTIIGTRDFFIIHSDCSA